MNIQGECADKAAPTPHALTPFFGFSGLVWQASEPDFEEWNEKFKARVARQKDEPVPTAVSPISGSLLGSARQGSSVCHTGSVVRVRDEIGVMTDRSYPA